MVLSLPLLLAIGLLAIDTIADPAIQQPNHEWQADGNTIDLGRLKRQLPEGGGEPENCDKQQKLFFYIDVTANNMFENFCPLIIVIQMLVAAFNPSSTSGTQIASLLFSDNVKNKPPSPVFDMDTLCFDAVQGSSRSLSSLIIDFGKCIDNCLTGYDSLLFPSSCGEGTSAVQGLREIHRIASGIRNPTEGAILMITDGVIEDDAAERTRVLSDLNSIGIRTLIAAGINEADEENLSLYTSNDNILVGTDPVQLGIDVVNKMEERGIICRSYADNIIQTLNMDRGGDLINLFCQCHRAGLIIQPMCQLKYPTCNGDLNICLPNQPGAACSGDIVFNIEFSPSAYTVSEDDGFIDLVITKTAVGDAVSNNQNITVLFSTSDGTADQKDYSSPNLSVTFTPDEFEKSVRVLIVDDTLSEDSETFYGNLKISHSESLARVVAAVATIEILSDCNCNCTDGNCSCNSGYFGNGSTCPDDDECKNGLNDCDINATCINTDGSFECTCNDGFLGDGKTCINDTTENLVPCPCNSSESCFSFDNNCTEVCACSPGYVRRLDSETCTDVDECGSYVCGNGTCINMPGSFICICPPGYTFNLDQQCTDLDECRTGINHCNENADCFNTEGSYSCTCRDGFIGNGITCLNNSDCETLNCSQLCVNTIGSLTCACHPGFYLNTLNLRECEDLDECKFDLYSCNINADCKNTIGSYKCECRNGYRGSGNICNDIDECDTGLDSCPESSNCRNSIGNYSCGVPPDIEIRNPERPNHSLSYSVGTSFCLEDMDSLLPNIALECSLSNEPDPLPQFNFTVERISLNFSRMEMLQMQTSTDSVLQLNETTLLSLFSADTESIVVTCVVYNTFGNLSVATNITICDPTECQDGVTNNCTQTCNRTLSNETFTYECGCDEGYQLNSDSTTCDDIDECSITEFCVESKNRICKNTIGSYECDCKDGYQENKTSNICEDIDECQDQTLNSCSTEQNEECVNTEGNYTCQCNSGYKYISSKNRCRDINECKTNQHNCSDRMLCNNTMGSYECICKEGYNSSAGNEEICPDIDECMSHPCHANATCTNTPGAYICGCDPGYVGDGFICQLQLEGGQPNSQREIVIISSTVGAVMFVLLIAIVVIMIGICYYVSDALKKKSDFVDLSSPKDPNKYGEFDLESHSKTIFVQSSYNLHLPPYLLIHSANIKLSEPIGQGEFGIVYKGYIVKEQGSIVTDTVAIKTLKGLYDRSTVRDMLKECANMYNFDHPNVLTLMGVCLDGGTAPYIIMPFMANGSLLAYLKKKRETLVVSLSDKDEDEVMTIRKRLVDMCIQVAKGMKYLTSKKMVHRDLAARNCMIDMNFVIKVADFGMAESVETKEYFREDKSSHIKLPLRWLAPESMNDYVFSEKSDVWAYGVTCWEIFSGGKVPYGGVDVTDLSRLVADGHRLEKPNNDAISDQLYKLILQCWEFEAVNRPRFAGIVNALSESLGAMAGYLDVVAFSGETIVGEINECRESLELVEEHSLNYQASSAKEECQDVAPLPDESTV